MGEMNVKEKNRMERGTRDEGLKMEGGKHLREHKLHELIDVLVTYKYWMVN